MVDMTNEGLINWLRGKPANEGYEWSDPVNCLMGNYLADNQSAWGAVQYSDMPHYHEIAEVRPWTYGAALERAEKLQLPAPPLQIEAPKAKVRELVPA